jgi:hypothetical protein
MRCVGAHSRPLFGARVSKTVLIDCVQAVAQRSIQCSNSFPLKRIHTHLPIPLGSAHFLPTRRLIASLTTIDVPELGVLNPVIVVATPNHSLDQTSNLSSCCTPNHHTLTSCLALPCQTSIWFFLNAINSVLFIWYSLKGRRYPILWDAR